jgi:hypothetical protein
MAICLFLGLVVLGSVLMWEDRKRIGDNMLKLAHLLLLTFVVRSDRHCQTEHNL